MGMGIRKKQLRDKVSAAMHARGKPPFWSLATVLHGLSFLYAAGLGVRQSLYNSKHLSSVSLPCTVISVGNLTVGGTGKTPMTIHLAQLLQKMHFRVAVISRGYKGTEERSGAVVSDGRRLLCTPRQAGDEPYLMACLLNAIPVVIGKDRFAAGRTALACFQPDVLILDDGFQHRRLSRDLNLLLLDGQAPFGNGLLLPRGSLREPISAVKRSDAVILTRCASRSARPDPPIDPLVSPRPVFVTQHKTVIRGVIPARQPWDSRILNAGGPTPDPVLSLRRMYAFCGLAANQQFFDSLHTLGGQVKGSMGFDDHHPYSASDADKIMREARHAGCNCFATTEKDFVRLPRNVRFSMDMLVFGVDIDFFADTETWRQFVLSRLPASH
jgi:tetraacyldisaccharide 4'-kinase